MRAAIPIKENLETAYIYKRFARAPFMAVADTDTKEVVIFENEYATIPKDAGNKVLEKLHNEYNVDCCIAFELGLKVQKLATELDIRQVILHNDNQNLEDILKMLYIKQ